MPDEIRYGKWTFWVAIEDIRENPTIVLLENSSIIGVFSFVKSENETELEYFYIDPRYIGKGYGKKMWEVMQNDI